MRLLFRQKLFSWFDSYDINDENGNICFTVQGELAWGHKLAIHDTSGTEVGMVKEIVLTFLPKFELYENGTRIGMISKEFTLFKPKFDIDFNGWSVQGDWTEWEYAIKDANGSIVARISKELFHMTDHYVIDVAQQEDALHALMIVLAIDAEKCSRN